MVDYKTLAKVVEAKEENTWLRGSYSNRPLRIAFVLKDDLKPEYLMQIVAYNTILWGGIYNCLVPTNGISISEEWWKTLKQHNSDIIVFCGNEEKINFQELHKECKKRGLDPFLYKIWNKWENDIVERHAEGIQDFISGLSVQPLYQFYHENRRRIEEGTSSVRYPDFEKAYPFIFSVISKVGYSKTIFKQNLINVLSAERVNFSGGLVELFDSLAQFDNKMTPLNFTAYRLRRTESLAHHEREEGLSIILYGSNLVSDLCLFWNFRLAPTFRGKTKNFKEVLLPIDFFRKNVNLQRLIGILNEHEYWKTRKVTLFSVGVNTRRLNKFKERFQKEAGNNLKVKVGSNKPPIADFKVFCDENPIEVQIQGKKFTIKKPVPFFGEYIKNGNWVVDLELRDSRNRIYSFVDSTRLNDYLCFSPKKYYIEDWGYWIRQMPGRLSLKVTPKWKFVSGEIVNSFDAFQSYFKDKNFDIRMTDKFAYNEGFINLFKETKDLKLLEEENIRNLLWEMSSSTKAYNLNAIKGIIKKGKGIEKILSKLIENKIILRGIEFRCKSCGLLRWYPISTVDDVMQCLGCLKYVRIPLYSEFSYTLNELAKRAILSGAIPVILLNQLLDKYSFKREMYLMGIEVMKGKNPEIDIDLLASNRTNNILAECKQYRKGINTKQIRESKKQIRGLSRLATNLDYPIVLFATLLPQIPIELCDYMVNLSSRTSIPHHIISLYKMKLVDLTKDNSYIDLSKRDLRLSFKKP